MSDAEFSVFVPGCLDVLSIGKGDLRLSVGDSADDRDRARDLIEEMLRKGYSIFVETPGGPVRVTEFRPESMSYVVWDTPAHPPDETAAAEPKRRGRPRRTEIPVAGSKATAVGRTAGG